MKSRRPIRHTRSWGSSRVDRKEQYIDNGADFEDAINGVATDLGMTNAQVREAIVTPKEAKKISDEMYRMSYCLSGQWSW